MNDGVPATDPEPTSVGVVAPNTDASRIVDAIDAAGGVGSDVTGADSGDIDADPDAIVAVGDAGLRECVAGGVGVPVLPIAISRNGIASLPGGAGADAVKRFLAGEWPIDERPVLRVETPTMDGRALGDIALVTAEPASISEFAIAVGDAPTEGSAPLARVRADGVVVATPAGSRDYAHAADGPVVVDGTDAAAVVPISPFATDPDEWVVPLSAIVLTVERDDADVELLVDGRSLGTVEPGATARIDRDGTLRFARPNGASGDGLEKH